MANLIQAAGSLTVAGAFSAQAALHGSRVAVQAGARTTSYAELERRTNQLAALLQRRGIGRGDRIALLAENRREHVDLFLAAAKIGAMVACLNWRQADAELLACVRLVEPALAVVSPRYLATWRRLAAPVSPMLPMDEEWDARLAAEAAGGHETAVQVEDGLVILYTSGTTGVPKGAVISHRAMIARDLILRADRGLADEAFVAWTPLFHMGAVDPVFGTLMRGGKVIVMDGFDAGQLVDLIQAERIGHLSVVPGVVDALLQALEARQAKPAGIRAIGAMADLVPPQLLARLTLRLGAPWCNTFGSTETGSPPASRGLIAPGEVPSRLSKVQSSLCELRLVDDEDQAVPDGQPGEVALRSPSLFSGYWGADEVNAEAFRGGWYHMGDVMVRNADGTLDYVDRKKYLIKSGGENIYPAEIERVLRESPRIAEAVVVRRADDRWGEVPVAFVVPADPSLTAEDVVSLCRGRIAGYKLPRQVRFVAEADMPRNASGKVERRALERLAA
jgi:acyl-CoA synthetase (AMP-forming)/AMP-acid ligase II